MTTPPAIRLMLVALLALPLFGTAAEREPWQASSGAARTHLLELYTSEGCNSCPPADRWVAGLAGHPALWTDVVPVAFHVTYWDGLGWADPFGNVDFDARQRRVAGRAGSVVYTPGVFLDGREWRRWRRLDTFAADEDRAEPGRLEAVLADDGTLTVTFHPRTTVAEPRVRLAWLLADQDSDVRRGENRGRRLHHEFVVHRLDRAPMTVNDGVWRGAVAVPDDVRARSRALAIWVVDGDGRPLQATGGWL